MSMFYVVKSDRVKWLCLATMHASIWIPEVDLMELQSNKNEFPFQGLLRDAILEPFDNSKTSIYNIPLKSPGSNIFIISTASASNIHFRCILPPSPSTHRPTQSANTEMAVKHKATFLGQTKVVGQPITSRVGHRRLIWGALVCVLFFFVFACARRKSKATWFLPDCSESNASRLDSYEFETRQFQTK